MRALPFGFALTCLLCAAPLWAEMPSRAELDAAAKPAFTAGTHGEPYTVEALLQGCGETEMGYACTFYAEGARWIAAKDGPSNAAALAVLGQLPVNAPLLVSGDMVSFGDITVDAVISTVTPAEPDAYAKLRDLSQGDWVDSTDPQSALRIAGSEETSIYAGDELGIAVVSFTDACPGAEPDGSVYVIKQMMGEDPMDVPCYAVLGVTADRMDLSYVGRGNMLSYVRP